MRARLADLSREAYILEGAAAAKLPVPGWEQYPSVLLFLSLKTEIDTGPLLEAAFAGGKKVFLPRVEGPAESFSAECSALRFYRIESLAGPWRKGPFGIREPAAGLPLGPEDFPALIFTPGLAFDLQCRRLGRGGAYYDRFFAGLDSGGFEYTAIGLCLDCQIVEAVPVEARDKRMDGILSGRGFRAG
jgi:5-formyltetrahydrofolate cyclo-ligase